MLLWRQKKVWYIESLGWIKFELDIKRLQKNLKRSCNGYWPELQSMIFFPFQIFIILKSRITFSSVYIGSTTSSEQLNKLTSDITKKNLWFTPLLGGPLRMNYVLWPKCLYALVVVFLFLGVPPRAFFEREKKTFSSFTPYHKI